MKKHALIVVASAAGLCLASAGAEARVTQFERPGADTCFISTYVPNLVQENTRGRLLYGPRGFVNNGVGGRVSGGIVRVGTEPAVYYKTQTIVEREHYTLTPGACP